PCVELGGADGTVVAGIHQGLRLKRVDGCLTSCGANGLIDTGQCGPIHMAMWTSSRSPILAGIAAEVAYISRWSFSDRGIRLSDGVPRIDVSGSRPVF